MADVTHLVRAKGRSLAVLTPSHAVSICKIRWPCWGMTARPICVRYAPTRRYAIRRRALSAARLEDGAPAGRSARGGRDLCPAARCRADPGNGTARALVLSVEDNYTGELGSELAEALAAVREDIRAQSWGELSRGQHPASFGRAATGAAEAA